MNQVSLEPMLVELKEGFQRAAKSKDRSALELLLHANYSFLSPEGLIIGREQLIENILHPTTNFLNHNFNRVERKISVSADGNTVTEAADVDLIGDLIGEDRTGAYINTATYVKRDGRWQILANTITAKAANRPDGEHT